MSDFKRSFKEWAKQYDIEIDKAALGDFYVGAKRQIMDQLFSVFEPSAVFTDTCETGSGPSEYLRPLVVSFLDLLDESAWSVSQVSSENEWDTASVELVNTDGTQYSFSLDDLEGSDWVPGSLFDNFELFSKNHCRKVLKAFITDDPYRLVLLSPEAVSDLEQLVEAHAKPDDEDEYLWL